MNRRTSTRLAALALGLPLAVGLSACGGGGEPAGESSSSASQDTGDGSGANAGTIEVSIDGGQIEPVGKRVTASVGEEIVLEVTADQPGELHVHSTPEQTVSYDAGTTRASVPVEQPGVIEVESHDPAVVILQIETR